jgi:signal transduction histidine kinase
VKSVTTPKLTKAQWRMVAMVLIMNLAIVLVAWAALEASFRAYQDRASVLSHNINRLVSQSLAGELERIDLALRFMADEAAHLPPGADAALLVPFLDRMQQRLAVSTVLLVTNAGGKVIARSGQAGPDLALGDRDYMAALRDNPNAPMVVSEPILGRLSGKWVLIFGRRVERAGGVFAGAVLVPVPIEWFETKFADLQVGPNGTVVMRGDASRNFDLLARFPHAGFVGQTKVSQTFRDMISAHPTGGTYEAQAGADNVRRTFSYQPIGSYPLITLVGLAAEDYAEEWRRDALKVVVLALAFIIVTSWGGVRMLGTWRALERRTEELARSNADLEQFAYVASHDLQTPIRNIASYAQLLSRRYRGRLDSDADEFIDYIVGGAKHMSAMIPDLLGYARVSTTAPAPVAVDLAGVIQDVLRRLGPTIDEVKAKVVVGRLPVILADERQASSLLHNLIENALTYRDPGRLPEITVSAAPDGGGMWRIEVKDNGIGIDPVYFDKIFTIFQRLEPARFPHGTGIGLALCQRIVRRFGGRIWVTSQEGKGATFHFTAKEAPSHPTALT